jgi:hypothetical protein
MSEADLDAAIAVAKELPQNVRYVEETFAVSDQKLAEIGISDWLSEFDKKYPHTE